MGLLYGESKRNIKILSLNRPFINWSYHRCINLFNWPNNQSYLVNFDVLCEKLEKLNIIPLDEDDIKKINWLPGGKSVGSFQTIYDNMASIPADSPMKND